MSIKKFNQYQLHQVEQINLKAGGTCSCACPYASSGGASTAANCGANSNGRPSPLPYSELKPILDNTK